MKEKSIIYFGKGSKISTYVHTRKEKKKAQLATKGVRESTKQKLHPPYPK